MKFSHISKMLAAGIVAVLSGCATEEASQVHLKGQLLGMPNRIVTMSYDGASSMLGNSKDIALYLDAEGCFDTIISLQAPAYYNISRNTLYLSPGDDLDIKITQKNTEAEFSGKGAEANLYLKNRLFPHAGSYLHGGVNMKENFVQTRRFVDSMAMARREQLDNLRNVSKEFKKMENARISADILNSYSYYPTYANIYAQVNKAPEVAIRKHQVDSFYTALADEMKPLAEELNHSAVLDVAVARSVLGSLMNDRQLKGWTDGITFLPEIKELLAASKWIDRLNGHIDVNVINGATDFAQSIGNEEYAQEILQKAKSAGRLLPGQPAVDFTLSDVEGNNYSLSDFKGKVLYLDFWATWCGPCTKESPHFESLAKKFIGKDVLFLPISMDNSKKTWSKYLKSHSMELDQYHSIDPILKNEWAIKGIPRFVLIDKNFNIVNAYAERPSDAAVYEIIQGLLE